MSKNIPNGKVIKIKGYDIFGWKTQNFSDCHAGYRIGSPPFTLPTGELSKTKIHNVFEWKIPEFSDCADYRYESPSFTFMDVSSCLLTEVPGPFDDCLTVSVINENEYPSDVTVAFSIKKHDDSLIKANGIVVEGKGKHCVNFMSLDKRILKKEKFKLFPGDTLTIVCDFMFESDWKQKLTAKGSGTLKETPKHSKLTEIDVLSKNFKELLCNKDSCDAVLLVQGKEFKVHKSILIARSPVFAAEFQNDAADGKEAGTVVISDCDPDSFWEFLEYLYCGRLEDFSSNSALHLYYTSDKYKVKELKEFCTKYLMHNLTLQNICDVVCLADKYGETSLLSAAQDFFNKNLEEILNTNEWKNLFKKDFCLANDLLIEMSKVKK